ncbi:hypothetical protein J7T55_012012 [Diaporthe amygdali]|uniref:uncharacterized protein n=1 Tax=Phomopsis amygdali TaxID=1214568 RepID=UPI0022FE8EA4|nr:uncharacterized protein J7T55_012012 [Diaporthe amygdali]KAJ0123547.1 hypothetical protein J7T55_012012 [Diaporthe amygdali]
MVDQELAEAEKMAKQKDEELNKAQYNVIILYQKHQHCGNLDPLGAAGQAYCQAYETFVLAKEAHTQALADLASKQLRRPGDGR